MHERQMFGLLYGPLCFTLGIMVEFAVYIKNVA